MNQAANLITTQITDPIIQDKPDIYATDQEISSLVLSLPSMRIMQQLFIFDDTMYVLGWAIKLALAPRPLMIYCAFR
jgi:hypothetical protein